MSYAVSNVSFEQLSISPALLDKVIEKGYQIPTPIQAKSIPVLLSGRDLLGQSQTGTGKTAAFALPLLSRIDCKNRSTQVLVLTPTRELAMQVSEAFCEYGSRLGGLRCLPIYGGQSMSQQLRALKQGVHVVVGTPGRIIDHLRRRTLNLSTIRSVVLDEADEMLKMGFLEDIEHILEHTPNEKQVALFSATMPKEIRRIAAKHLKNEKHIHIAGKTSTVETIKQYYWLVQGLHKLDALSRLLETQEVDAMLIFVRTKTATVELAEQLEARGYACAALNGDLSQPLRERTIARLKNGEIKIIVATDVAARGLDVECISHVINYDIPYDTESYVHRIGRTGRAGRSGTAILFVSPREKRILHTIERSTRQKIEVLPLPSKREVTRIRIESFKTKVEALLSSGELEPYAGIVDEIVSQNKCDSSTAAAALCFLAQQEQPFFLKEETPPTEKEVIHKRHHRPSRGRNDRVRRVRTWEKRSRRGGKKARFQR